MPKPNSDEIITQKHKRNFIQFGGAGPENVVKYAGQDAQYIAIDGVSLPESGGIDPIFVPDPRRQGAYRLVGRSITPPRFGFCHRNDVGKTREYSPSITTDRLYFQPV